VTGYVEVGVDRAVTECREHAVAGEERIGSFPCDDPPLRVGASGDYHEAVGGRLEASKLLRAVPEDDELEH